MGTPFIQPPSGNAAQPSVTSVAAPTPGSNVGFAALGLAASITPVASGRIKVDISGMIGNSTIGDGGSVHIIYGTGTAPANGTGTPVTGEVGPVGSVKAFVASTAAGVQGFACNAVVTGLTLNTHIR